MGVSYEDVIASFHMVLGRAPDSEDAVNYHVKLGFRDRIELGAYMLATDEFRIRFDQMVAEGRVKQGRTGQGGPQRPMTIFLGDRVLTQTHRGLRIYVAPTDLDLSPHLMLSGIWEANVERALNLLVRPGMRAVDIGANVGYHTLTIGAAVGAGGDVQAFEANPSLCPLLTASIFANDMSPWVKVHNLAVMDRPGSITLGAQPNHFGSGNVVPPGVAVAYHDDYSQQVEVQAVTLDDMLGNGPALDFIRIDIEGSEPQALRGAAGLIERSPNLSILSEWSMAMMSFRSDVPAFLGWLEGLGFRFWVTTQLGGFDPITAEAMLGLPHSDVLISRQDPPG